MDLKNVMRTIPDFPKPGIIFRDITPILKDKASLNFSIDTISKIIEPLDCDYIVGPESRGFIFGVPVAYKLYKGFLPIRKAGKLPYKTISKEYSLEYGTATIEMHEDAIEPGSKIVLVDDLLATGGTAKAAVDLIEMCGGVVKGMIFLIELEELCGRDCLKDYYVESILKY